MTTSPSKPFQFEGLNQSLLEQRFLSTNVVLGRKGLEKLDLLLLVIEALDLNGSQGMLWTSDKLGLQVHLPNQVELWKCRCHNPLRKTSRRGPLNSVKSDALILLICSMAEKLYPKLRQLISSKEPTKHYQDRWLLFYERLTDLISERFNNRRGAVKRLLLDPSSENLFRNLIVTLALSVGPGGVDRLRTSLLDPNY